MASVVIRSILGPSALPLSRFAPLRTAGVTTIIGARGLHQSCTRSAEEKAAPASVTSTASPTSSGPSAPSAASSSTSTPSTARAVPKPAGHTPTINLNPTPPPSSPRTTGNVKFRWEPEHHPSTTRYSSYSDSLPTHTLSVISTRNNVLLTFSDRLGPVVPTISAGSGKSFKKAGRASYEAANQAALKMFGQIMDFASYRAPDQEIKLRVALKGIFGQGRQAVQAAIEGKGGSDILRLMVAAEDRTPLKIGGTRARKARRL